ncbi:FAD dependent oxidoreductase [Desulfuromonas acetoxidans DSM 684]|uniref:FAD dependent oxidoreductase n=1 Tax=Desulfuromonas acetoxidans (strain DSM 684 / 11070) TaxID=281689 RepID=Q1K0P5_DESA6|nr:FAD dependent oxidoreductase [Desulfuromonas acetoxidans DSM 684]
MSGSGLRGEPLNYDAVIVGGGISGATCALVLSHFGWRVAVVEREAHITPLLRGFSRHGVHHDTGFHYAGGLGKGEVLDRFLGFLGLSRKIELYPFKRQGFDRIIDRSTSDVIDFSYAEQDWRDSLLAAFPHEATAIDRFQQTVLSICDSMPYLNTKKTFGEEGLFAHSQDVSLQSFVAELTQDHRLRAALCLHCLLHGTPPDQIPLRLHAAVVGPYCRSVHGVRGGGSQLSQAFDDCLQQAGVDSFCSSTVTAMSVGREGEIAGVLLASGQKLVAKQVIHAADPRLLLDWLDERCFRPVYRRRLAALQETQSALVLFGRSAQPVDALAGRNLYLADLQQGTQLFSGTIAQRPLYLSSAGQGCGIIGIMPEDYSRFEPWQNTRRGQRPDDYRHVKQQYCEQIMERIDQTVPEISQALQSPFLATPLTLRDYLHYPQGAVYGVSHQLAHYPLQVATRVRGLYLSGQALAAPGLMGAMVGAFYTCGTLLGHQRVAEELNQCH